MFFKTTLLGLFFLIDYAYGSCGVCQTNNVACHSATSFSLCVKGNHTDSKVSCPVGTVCTDQPSICVDDSIRSPTCNNGCDACNSRGKLFSCVSQTSFAFCFGETKPFYAVTGSCLDGYVCNLSSRSICVKDTESKPSCEPRDDATFCSEIAKEGYFKAEGDTTCAKYYICRSSSIGGYTGFNYTCLSPNYYNPELEKCQRERPANC